MDDQIYQPNENYQKESRAQKTIEAPTQKKVY